jgi:hypothetical protein
MTWVVIWIETDGTFCIRISRTLDLALTVEQNTSESGLPTMMFSSDEFIRRVSQPDDRLVEEACEVMHDAYEQAALGAGWETNPASRKPWADVPEANKATMRAAVIALLGWLDD